MVYYITMKIIRKCSTSSVVKMIRVMISLLIIGLGIYYKNWVGALGILTLITALTGKCGLSVDFSRSTSFKLKDREN